MSIKQWLVPNRLERMRQRAAENAYKTVIHWDRYYDVTQGHKKWHEKRVGIGSSNAIGAFMMAQLSDTASPRKLYCHLQLLPPDAPNEHLEDLFAKGHYYEHILRYEFERISGRVLCQPGIFCFSKPGVGLHCGETLNLYASCDALAFCPLGQKPPFVAEFKWRTKPGAGWGPNRDTVNFSVLCQVFHQMRVTGIRSAFIYCGAVCGDRKLWHVSYPDEDYFTWWDAHASKMVYLARTKSPLLRVPVGRAAKTKERLMYYMNQCVTRLDLTALIEPQAKTDRPAAQSADSSCAIRPAQ